MKRAILLRHATAAEGREDPLRELTAAGVQEATRAGASIVALGADWLPTRALCSTALRASATLAGVRAALAPLAATEFDAALYLASATRLLAALQRLPEEAACVLLVAHEPGISELVRRLVRRGDPGARSRFAAGMAPAAFAALALDVARWKDAAAGCAELAAFARP